MYQDNVSYKLLMKILVRKTTVPQWDDIYCIVEIIFCAVLDSSMKFHTLWATVFSKLFMEDGILALLGGL